MITDVGIPTRKHTKEVLISNTDDSWMNLDGNSVKKADAVKI